MGTAARDMCGDGTSTLNNCYQIKIITLKQSDENNQIKAIFEWKGAVVGGLFHLKYQNRHFCRPLREFTAFWVWSLWNRLNLTSVKLWSSSFCCHFKPLNHLISFLFFYPLSEMVPSCSPCLPAFGSFSPRAEENPPAKTLAFASEGEDRHSMKRR